MAVDKVAEEIGWRVPGDFLYALSPNVINDIMGHIATAVALATDRGSLSIGNAQRFVEFVADTLPEIVIKRKMPKAR